MGFYDFTIQTITLSDGTKYTPRKDNRPEYPCGGCKDWDECSKRTEPCDRYNDYERALCVWKRAVFD